MHPLSHHGCCAVHLWANYKSHCKCPASLKPVFNDVVYAYTKIEFDDTMKRMLSASPSLYNYLTEDSKPEYWSRCHFPGKRYNLMNTNIVESLNRQLVNEKQWPIYAFLVAI